MDENDNILKDAVIDTLRRNGDWMSQEDIVRDLWFFFPHSRTQGFHNSGARRKLTRVINEINADPAVPVIISHSEKGNKIATPEEATAYANDRYREAFAMLRQARTLDKKIGLDRQINIDGENYNLGGNENGKH